MAVNGTRSGETLEIISWIPDSELRASPWRERCTCRPEIAATDDACLAIEDVNCRPASFFAFRADRRVEHPDRMALQGRPF